MELVRLLVVLTLANTVRRICAQLYVPDLGNRKACSYYVKCVNNRIGGVHFISYCQNIFLI